MHRYYKLRTALASFPTINALGALALLLSATPANAYVDPNSGGLLYQLFLPILVAISVGWTHVKAFLRALIQKLRGPRPPP